MSSKALFLLLFCLSSICWKSIGQHVSATDSLLSLVDGAPPQKMPELYNLLSWQFKNNDPDKALDYAIKALEKGRELKQYDQIAKSLNNLGLYFSYQGQHEEALIYLKELIILAEANSLILEQADGQLNTGNIYYHQSKYEEALERYELADSLYQVSNNQKMIAIVLINMGLINYETGFYSNALDFYFKAQHIYDNMLESKGGYGALLNNIGNVYLELKDLNKALVYYKKSQEVNQELGDQRRLCTSLRMISKIHLLRDSLDEASVYQQESQSIAEKLGDRLAMAKSARQMGEIYLKRGEHIKAEELLLHCLDLMKDLTNEDLEAQVYFLLGRIHFLRKNFQVAINIYTMALSKAQGVDARNLIADIYLQLWITAENLGQNTAALGYAEKHIKIKDSLFNDNIYKRMAAQEKYESERNEKELAYYRVKNLELENESRKDRFLSIMLAVISGVLVLIGFLWYKYLRAKQKSVIAIHEMNEEVNSQKILHLIKNNEVQTIKSKIEGQETERKRLAQELHDGVGSTLAALKLHLDQVISDNPNPAVINVINKLNGAYNEVRTISRNLTPPVILNSFFTDLLRNYLKDVPSKKGMHVDFECYPEAELNLIGDNMKTDIYRIVQELLSNVLKHAKANQVVVQLIKHEDYINLMLEDDGIGFSSIIKGQGIGLLNIKSRIDLLNGNFEVNSEEGRGTLINIDIPCKTSGL